MPPARSAYTAKAWSSAIPLFFGVNGVNRPVDGSSRLTAPAHVAIQIFPCLSSASDRTASEFRLLVCLLKCWNRPEARSNRLRPPPSVATHVLPRESSRNAITELKLRLVASPATER